ncbi:MAG: glpA, partial [Clostridia bacterium]|nr:glpA [Clostridia bacterium]
MFDKVFDFAVVGAGVTGAWIALQLSRYDTSVCLVEKDNDVCMGATKANSAIIHAGYDAKTGTYMAKLNVQGNEIIRKHYKEMSIPFRQIGSLVLAFTDEDLITIRELYQRGINNGVKAEDMELLSAEQTLKIEPNLNSEVKGSLYAKTAGVASAFELCIAAAEVAVKNGVELKTNFKVINIEEFITATAEQTKYNILTSEKGEKISAKYIINAAGVYADEIARLMGDTSFTVIPRRGEYCILDKNKKDMVKHIIF